MFGGDDDSSLGKSDKLKFKYDDIELQFDYIYRKTYFIILFFPSSLMIFVVKSLISSSW